MSVPLAYYNEHDKFAAAWLVELIAAGVIADGVVDTRSIKDVRADELEGFTQCHFFAGIGGWSYALRLAGYPDDRPVWTGSCPCQSFSAAGKGEGFNDPRHLWPEWFRLIRECRPNAIFGEQVEAAVRHGWLDLVSTDLEREGYAVGATILGAHSAGAPHIRQRLYFCADTTERGIGPHDRESGESREPQESIGGYGVFGWCGESATRRCAPGRSGEEVSGETPRSPVERSGDVGSGIHANGTGSLSRREASAALGHRSAVDSTGGAIGNPDTLRTERWPLMQYGVDGRNGQNSGREEAHSEPGTCGEVCGGSDTTRSGRRQEHANSIGSNERITSQGADRRITESGEVGIGSYTSGERLQERKRHGRIQRETLEPQTRETAISGSNAGQPGWLDSAGCQSAAASGATRGFWAGCDWWYGRDGKYRPIGPGIFPLAHGVPARVGRLRGYGNAIVPQVAAEFIQAYLEITRR